MKIDKIIFSTSERFSVFWNINSKIWNSFGVEPVCLLFGDRKNTDMTEEFGEIIEMPILENIPLIIQITWSKFYWPIYEPEKTYMIGDIDLLPLQYKYFYNNILDLPDDNYVHLDCDAIAQLAGHGRSWIGATSSNLLPDWGHETNLPAHYHCAKGKIFKEALEQNGTFEQELIHIVDSKLYNNTRAYRESDPIDQHDLWCSEEHRSTKAIRRSIKNNKIKFTGFSLKNGIKAHFDGHENVDTIDKSMYDENTKNYLYDHDRLVSQKYVDLHCIRPFSHVGEEERKNRWEANLKILNLAGTLP